MTELDRLIQIGRHVVVHGQRGKPHRAFLFQVVEYFANIFIVEHLRHGNPVRTVKHVEVIGLQSSERVFHQLVHSGLYLGFPFLPNAIFLQHQVSHVGCLKLIVLPLKVLEVITRLEHSPLLNHGNRPLFQIRLFFERQSTQDILHKRSHKFVIKTNLRGKKKIIAVSRLFEILSNYFLCVSFAIGGSRINIIYSAFSARLDNFNITIIFPRGCSHHNFRNHHSSVAKLSV